MVVVAAARRRSEIIVSKESEEEKISLEPKARYSKVEIDKNDYHTFYEKTPN